MLDKRRATFDPVTTIAIYNLVDLRNFRAMDMSAADARYTVALGGSRDCVFEITDCLDRVFNSVFDIFRERPMRKSKPSPTIVERKVQIQ